MSRFRDDRDWDIMSSMPAPVGNSLIEQLMAGPNQYYEDPYSPDVRASVQKAIAKLDPKDRFVVEAVYIWGHSYSEVAEMMGYNSKGSPHYVLQKAQRNLRDILEQDETIIELLKGNKMPKPETWQDAAWKQLRYLDKGVTIGDFMPDMLDIHFANLGAAVTSNDTIKMYDICWAIGHEAARGLRSIDKWDAEQIADLLASKQNDYGHDNINAFGIIGVAVRISDKIARYNNLTGRNKAKNEPLEDTLVDMVGYAVISRMLEDGTFDLELER